MTQNAHKPYSEFELELIKKIPSNMFIAWVTGRNNLSISSKRASIGAPESGSLGLKKAKKTWMETYKEIAAKHGIDTKVKPKPRKNVLQQAVEHFIPISVTITINDKIVEVNQGDELKINEKGIFLITKI